MRTIRDGRPTVRREARTVAEEGVFTPVARSQLPRLYALARRVAGAQAEDVVQETLLRAYRAFGGLRDPVATEAWFTSILLNVAKDRYRYADRHVREVPHDPVEGFSLYRTIASEDPFPYSDSLHVDFLCRFGTEDVWEVLAGLPELYRVPLVLVHMEGRSTREVSDHLGCPIGTLCARLSRGRKLFERALWAYAVANDLLREEPTTVEVPT